jgi:hypothetical protein
MNFTLRRDFNVVRYAVLRNCAKWMMLLGVFVALSLRAFGIHHFHEETGSKCTHSAEICHKSPSVANVGDDDQKDNKSCPPDHEHHSCCSSALPLIVDSDSICWLGILESSLLGVRHDGEVPPEEPFLASEKPPLI